MIRFEFLYKVWGLGWGYFLFVSCTRVSNCSNMSCWKAYPFSIELSVHLSKINWPYLRLFLDSVLFHGSVHSPVHTVLITIALSLKSSVLNFPTLFLFLGIVFFYSSFFAFSLKFQIQLAGIKKAYFDCIESTDLGRIYTLTTVDPWAM